MGKLGVVLTLCAGLIGSAHAATAEAIPAVWFDGAGLTYDEECLVEALQGLVNRAGPRLMMNLPAWDMQDDRRWVDIYRSHNGLAFREDIGDLAALLRHFRQSYRGLVVYDPGVDGSRYVAMTLAGLEDLLPVSPGILAGYCAGLRTGRTWAGADFAAASPAEMAGGWGVGLPTSIWEAVHEHQPGRGLLMRNRLLRGDKSEQTIVQYGPLALDLSAFPILEAEIGSVSDGGSWEVQFALPKPGGGDEYVVVGAGSVAGTRQWDLAAQLAGRGARVRVDRLRLVTRGKGAEVLWKYVRPVGRDGKPPTPPKPQLLADLLGVPVKHDLRGKFHDSLQAYDWALRNLMPRVDRRYAHTVGGSVDGRITGSGPWKSMDFVVMHRGFVFNLTFNAKETSAFGTSFIGDPKQAAMYRRILSALEQPAFVTGYGDSENDWFPLMNEYGHSYLVPQYRNCSFHAAVRPRRTPVQAPRRAPVRLTPDDANKTYVCFLSSDGDTMKGPISLQYRSWTDDRQRGSVPFTYCMPTCMGRYFPAMLEYYYDTATPNDDFAACAVWRFNGAAALQQRLWERVAEDLRLSDMRNLAPVTMEPVPMAAFEPLARAAKPLGIAEIVWGGMFLGRQGSLTDGTPLVTNPDWFGYTHRVLDEGKWEAVPLDHAFADKTQWPQAVAKIVAHCEKVATAHPHPFVILVFSSLHQAGVQYSMHADIAKALDPNRFVVMRLSDAFAALRAGQGAHTK